MFLKEVFFQSYWPELDEIVRVGSLVINCQAKLDHLGPFIHREFLAADEQTGEMRAISHCQYLEWPDHGAPVLASQFLEYVRHIQKLGNNEEENVVLVHCSAGIGRTGAFILLDSVLRLVESDCPINPIHLIKMMRDQRPMMLQTSVNIVFPFKFTIIFFFFF
jgi:protein tyrosine phosphatase